MEPTRVSVRVRPWLLLLVARAPVAVYKAAAHQRHGARALLGWCCPNAAVEARRMQLQFSKHKGIAGAAAEDGEVGVGGCCGRVGRVGRAERSDTVC